ncbi:MAG TPA: hypothetical protein PLY80_19585 [Pseudomonadota bacterium]|nr:hypothetical protein [Pseudomonadota bacterium]
MFLGATATHVFREGNHTLLVFIPQLIKHAAEALAKGDGIGHLVHHRIFVVASGQLIVGHQGVEVAPLTASGGSGVVFFDPMPVSVVHRDQWGGKAKEALQSIDRLNAQPNGPTR